MIAFKSKIFCLPVIIVLLSSNYTQGTKNLFRNITDNYHGSNNKKIKFLIQNKADLNKKENSINNDSLLHLAVLRNYNKQHNNIVKILIKNKANINAQNVTGKTPLHSALEHNKDGINNKIIKFFIEHKATLNFNHTNFSWKFFVQHSENIRLIPYYYESGINFLIKDSKGKFLKDYANNEALKNILKIQRKNRTPEETKQVQTFLTINKIIAKKNKVLKIPKPLLKLIFGYLKIPTYKNGVLLF